MVLVPNGGMHKNSMQFARQLGVSDCRWHDVHTEFDDRNPEHVANRTMRHEVLSGFQLVPELGATTLENMALRVYPDPGSRVLWQRTLQQGSRPLVGIFIANRSRERRWHVDKWKQLTQRVSLKADVFVIYDPNVTAQQAGWHGIDVRHVLTESVTDLITVASLLDLIVSADSAPVHLASALSVPVVALFQDMPEKYLRWHPLGVDSVILRCGRSVDDIGVDLAIEAVLDLLARALG